MSTSRKIYACIVCSKRTKPGERRPLTGSANKKLRKFLKKTFLVEPNDTDCICNRCRLLHYSNEKSKQKMVNEVAKQTEKNRNSSQDVCPPSASKSFKETRSPQTIPMQLHSSGYSHKSCFLCNKKHGRYVVVPEKAVYQLFLRHSIILKNGARCCPEHLRDDLFKVESIENMQDVNTCEVTHFNKSGIKELVENVRKIAVQAKQKRIDFDDRLSLNSDDYYNLTGLHRDEFEELLDYTSDIRDTKTRTSRTCLGIFLMKLKSGLDNKILGTLFNMTKFQVRRAIKSCRKVLVSSFVPHYLGFNHISRDDVIQNHTSLLAKELLCDITDNPAILVLDGTYIYIQKSGNFSFSRRSFSMHKHRPLVKPMMVVSTTGYIISALGPYLADSRNSDAKILNHMIATNTEEMKEWVEANDILVVDRGFRDSEAVLEDLGIKMEMPSFLQKGCKQHTTEEANSSRLVTKVRWVVESANARLKSWRYLDKVLPNSQIPNIGDFVRIVCAIINKFRPPLRKNSIEDQASAAKMIYLAKQPNAVHRRIEEEGLDSRSCKWVKMNESDAYFPTISEQQLRDLTVGVYQIKLAKSYVQEHIDESGSYDILVNCDIEGMLCVKIQSRHISSKRYACWIEYDEGAVTGHYCKCKAGSRVVGTCAHVASVLWYMGYARHLENPSKGVCNWVSFLDDAGNLPEPVDSSDEEPEE